MSTATSALCGICGSCESESLLPGVERARRCRCCGTGYTNGPLPSGSENLFDERYYRGYFERAAQWRHEACRRLDWLLESAVPRGLLEVGCAGGFFLEAARRRGIDAYGVERSPDAAAYARETLGMPVEVGALEDSRADRRFDAVCAFHVLEHVSDPWAFLECAGEHLQERGILAIEVPNCESARAERSGAAWADLQVDRHRWHFSRDSLTRLLRSAGFEPRSLDTVSPRHYWRSRSRASRGWLALALQDRRAWGSWKTHTPILGDYLRVIAVRL